MSHAALRSRRAHSLPATHESRKNLGTVEAEGRVLDGHEGETHDRGAHARDARDVRDRDARGRDARDRDARDRDARDRDARDRDARDRDARDRDARDRERRQVCLSERPDVPSPDRAIGEERLATHRALLRSERRISRRKFPRGSAAQNASGNPPAPTLRVPIRTWTG
jgi:hypothetical protein